MEGLVFSVQLTVFRPDFSGDVDAGIGPVFVKRIHAKNFTGNRPRRRGAGVEHFKRILITQITYIRG